MSDVRINRLRENQNMEIRFERDSSMATGERGIRGKIRKLRKIIKSVTSAASQKNPERAFRTPLSPLCVHHRALLLQPPKAPSARSRRRKARGIRPVSYAGLSRPR